MKMRHTLNTLVCQKLACLIPLQAGANTIATAITSLEMLYMCRVQDVNNSTLQVVTSTIHDKADMYPNVSSLGNDCIHFWYQIF